MMMRMAAAGVLLAGAAIAQDTPLECKKYDVDTFRGCDDTSDGVLNYCDKVTEVDNTLCRTQEEKDLCANPAVTNVTACAAKYPTAMSVPTCVDDEDAATPACTGFADGGPTAANCPTGCTFLAAVDDPLTGTSADDAAPDAWVTGLTLTPKSWTFMTATVPAGVDMYHAKYSFEVPEYHGTVTAANAEDQMEKNISVAFLVGRCLEEVECGQCPPRAETLMSTEREPQICTLPDYCPGCQERIGQDPGGCKEYASLSSDDNDFANYKAYEGTWSNLKRCKTEEEATNFYIGIYTMDSTFGPGGQDDTVDVRLKLYWDATSAAPRSAPLLLALVAAFIAMFN